MKNTLIAILGLLLMNRAVAQTPHNMEMQPAQTGQFHRIEQPLENKAIVTLGGIGLISLELWWFLSSKPKRRKGSPQSEIQTGEN
ncbi:MULTISPECIES: hypothetical protein [Leptolyngbya]|jgi:plastocyanin domain-containing protein|uniref:Uncharacterized protein n=2 Tax=Leptolyngbya boryana TaxID=1184 RepID=A0A1Z4JK86_LEPBY|nr:MULTISPECIES: hypothetical protein [Leptolyngbya]BAY57146.1 hypothetical protein NIES2135_40100 [Leptolyngbya boryana NIES-2135]MBD1857295.1 hypothetical protein [Leptolyngbya sp. FACHB-1624]MBD2367103.1 hypothetical protein [Leptolyngbya sp. FACHB-161]MBD2373544.1 hypothetical protein [Leptolyngbya sp. FACHB-238]MBD2397952.1 hypothetical protein [Leptolyngbya sp. FACHB-239]